jgi:hypothetical protein
MEVGGFPWIDCISIGIIITMDNSNILLIKIFQEHSHERWMRAGGIFVNGRPL